jgi:peptidoglycan/LPS O-acetylase OafA/YrhL
MTQHSTVRKFLDNSYAFAAMTIFIICLPYLNITRYAYAVFVIPLLVRSAHTSRLGSYLLGGSVMVLLGELSYSIYLSHAFIHSMVLNLGRGQPMHPVYEWGSTYLLLLIWCLFCYHVIEVPARTKLRSLGWKQGAST